MNVTSYLILVGSVLAIAIADVALKQAGSYSHSMKQLLVNPWFLSAIVLYIIQVIGFGYLFISGAKLSSVGIVQTVLYALVVITSGVFIFSESISVLQGIGIGLSVMGVILMNI
jgi:drug/metabolite transporter (DMT)-like permease